MVPDSSILAWKVPWAEEPRGLTVHGATESDITEHMHTHARTHMRAHIHMHTHTQW